MKRIIIIIIAAAALFAYCSRERKDGGASFPEGSPLAEFTASISQFANVNSIDWETIPELINDPVEFNDEELRCMDSLGTPGFIPEKLKSSCERLKNYVHMKSLPLRSVSSDEVGIAVDRFEASFDSLFARCISQEYYMRLFHDCFNEIIPAALDSLVGTCQKINAKEAHSEDNH